MGAEGAEGGNRTLLLISSKLAPHLRKPHFLSSPLGGDVVMEVVAEYRWGLVGGHGVL